MKLLLEMSPLTIFKSTQLSLFSSFKMFEANFFFSLTFSMILQYMWCFCLELVLGSFSFSYDFSNLTLCHWFLLKCCCNNRFNNPKAGLLHDFFFSKRLQWFYQSTVRKSVLFDAYTVKSRVLTRITNSKINFVSKGHST